MIEINIQKMTAPTGLREDTAAIERGLQLRKDLNRMQRISNRGGSLMVINFLDSDLIDRGSQVWLFPEQSIPVDLYGIKPSWNSEKYGHPHYLEETRLKRPVALSAVELPPEQTAVARSIQFPDPSGKIYPPRYGFTPTGGPRAAAAFYRFSARLDSSDYTLAVKDS